MFHPNHLALVLTMALSLPLLGQYKSGMKALDKREYATAYAAFDRFETDPLANQMLRYGRALVLSKNRYEGYDPLRAYGILDTLLTERAALAPDLREKWDKKLSDRDIGRAVSAIEGRALRELDEDPTLAGYVDYLATYRRMNDRRRREVEEKRNALALEYALAAPDYDSTSTLISAYDLYEVATPENGLTDTLLNRFLRQYGWEAYGVFAAENEASPYVHSDLKPATDELLAGTDVAAAMTFVRQHSRDPFGLRVYEGLDSLIARSDDRAGMLDYLSTFSPETAGWEGNYRQYMRLTLAEGKPEAVIAARKMGQQKLGDDTYAALLPQLQKDLLDFLRGKDIPVDLRESLAPYADPKNELPEVWSPLVDHYLATEGEMAGAESFLEKYPDSPVSEEVKTRLKTAQMERAALLDSLKTNSIPFVLNDRVNTRRAEYFASESTDGRTLYFTRGLKSEDIYYARQDSRGEWLNGVPITTLNTEANESLLTVSADGTEMLLFRNGKIYEARKTGKGWRLGDPLPDYINTSGWQSDTWVSADGKFLFFSRRQESIDLMMSRREENGSWSEPVALDDLNTDFEDRCPVLAADLKTLYFTSMRPGGFGEGDIYVSTRLDDSWENWSEPKNLGDWVNTKGREWDFKITPDGERAYFSRLVDGKEDIFSVYLPEDRRPDPIVIVEGSVVSSEGIGIETIIQWINLENGELLQETRSDPSTGDFVASLPALDQGRVGYVINEKGFFPVSGSIEVGNEQRKIVLDAPLEVIGTESVKTGGLNLTLGNVFFPTGSAELDPASANSLDRIATYLIENEFCAEVAGHTDNVGSPANNKELSEARAKAVRSYLVEKGLAEDCLTAYGYGETQPVEDNEEENGRRRNRRVEIRVR